MQLKIGKIILLSQPHLTMNSDWSRSRANIHQLFDLVSIVSSFVEKKNSCLPSFLCPIALLGSFVPLIDPQLYSYNTLYLIDEV